MILLHKKAMVVSLLAISILCGTQIIASQLSLSSEKQAQSKFLYDYATTLSIPKMKELITKGADVNYGQQIGKLPILMLTSRDYNKTNLLLENGADINASYKFNEKDGTVTVLKYALHNDTLYNNDIRLIKLLLSYKPEFNHPSTIVKKNSLTIAQLFIKSDNLTPNEYCACLSESLAEKKIELAALFIKAYNPGKKALRLFKQLHRINFKAETIAFMQEYNDISDDEVAQITEFLRKPTIIEYPFLIQNLDLINMNQNSIESAQKAIHFFNLLKFEEDEKCNRAEIILFINQINNLSDDEFSNLTDYLTSDKLEKTAELGNPSD
jgi:hypothetical protein